METISKELSPRRAFLSKLALGATALGVGKLLSSCNTKTETEKPSMAAPAALHPKEEWFSQIKGKHRIVFDSTQPHEIFPFAWPRVFLMSNEKTGTLPADCSVVVVLRHSAIGYALNNPLWEKYHLGEVFKADDPLTHKPATRNPFWQPGPEDFKVPGVGPVQIGINNLQELGVMFCVCEMAMTVYSSVVAESVKGDAAAIRQEWVDGLLPGIHQVPSGVWALSRAQEHGCTYCFAG